MRRLHRKMQIRRYHQEIVEESEMEYINLKINGVEVSAPKGSTILEAARLANVDIPTLCI